MSYRSLFGFIAMLCFPLSTMADGITLGCSLLHTMQSYKEAISQCQKEAKGGSAEAARLLSSMFREGNGTASNSDEASKWAALAKRIEMESEGRRRAAVTPDQHLSICKQPYSADSPENTFPHCLKAAESGILEAQKELGLRYELGYGVPTDKGIAAKWYRLAAEQGDADSQYILAKDYSSLDISPMADLEQARWYKAAADQGHLLAQYALARKYFDNGGSNVVEARQWFLRVATEGEKQIRRDHQYSGILPNASDATVASQYHLGLIYKDGLGVPQDYANARFWFSKAAQYEHVEAQYQLGTMYVSGLGGQTNKVLGHMWLNVAASGSYGISKVAASAREKLASQMNSTEIAKAQELARIWFERRQTR
ncbi:MAG: tetratricopeptide repeat protein [Sulfuritalea sp.]|nr:tetratricopeptide repeat protein [Sulfuritalea sp.]